MKVSRKASYGQRCEVDFQPCPVLKDLQFPGLSQFVGVLLVWTPSFWMYSPTQQSGAQTRGPPNEDSQPRNSQHISGPGTDICSQPAREPIWAKPYRPHSFQLRNQAVFGWGESLFPNFRGSMVPWFHVYIVVFLQFRCFRVNVPCYLCFFLGKFVGFSLCHVNRLGESFPLGHRSL